MPAQFLLPVFGAAVFGALTRRFLVESSAKGSGGVCGYDVGPDGHFGTEGPWTDAEDRGARAFAQDNPEIGRRLSYSERKSLPAKAFIFPKTRSYPIAIRNARGRVVPSRSHAINARARASQSYRRGLMSQTALRKVWATTGELFDLPANTLPRNRSAVGSVPAPPGKKGWYVARTKQGWPTSGSNCFGAEPLTRYERERDRASYERAAYDRQREAPPKESQEWGPGDDRVKFLPAPEMERRDDTPKLKAPRQLIQDPTRCKLEAFPKGKCQNADSWRSRGVGGASQFRHSYFGDDPMYQSFGRKRRRPERAVLPGGREVFLRDPKEVRGGRVKVNVAIRFKGQLAHQIARKGVDRAVDVLEVEDYDVDRVLSAVVVMVGSPIGPVPFVQDGWAFVHATAKAG